MARPSTDLTGQLALLGLVTDVAETLANSAERNAAEIFRKQTNVVFGQLDHIDAAAHRDADKLNNNSTAPIDPVATHGGLFTPRKATTIETEPSISPKASATA
ncbi:MAG: hypothetical protein K0U29_07730 [Gammaproteobacteria bacterium]|nr:hypothetical protein [Gammaproteobacteria bacterium]MCH9744801.1 hypothetical protein [Gammaproteobacteria bacterium]